MQLLLTAGRSIISVGHRPAGRAAQLGDVSSGLTAARHRRLAVVDDAPAMALPNLVTPLGRVQTNGCSSVEDALARRGRNTTHGVLELLRRE